MYFSDYNEYDDIRKKSLAQWLDEMEQHEDIAVRGGIPLVRSYLATLENEKQQLKEECELKNMYLKKMREK